MGPGALTTLPRHGKVGRSSLLSCWGQDRWEEEGSKTQRLWGTILYSLLGFVLFKTGVILCSADWHQTNSNPLASASPATGTAGVFATPGSSWFLFLFLIL